MILPAGVDIMALQDVTIGDLIFVSSNSERHIDF